jgi:hypothetical protein
VLCVPVAVLRYRLWDLDRLVSRTVTYALVTALLVLAYLVILPVASRLLEGSGSLAVAAVTLAVAAAFQPLRPHPHRRALRGPPPRQGRPGRPGGGAAGGGRPDVQPTRASLWLRVRPADATKLYQART